MRVYVAIDILPYVAIFFFFMVPGPTKFLLLPQHNVLQIGKRVRAVVARRERVVAGDGGATTTVALGDMDGPPVADGRVAGGVQGGHGHADSAARGGGARRAHREMAGRGGADGDVTAGTGDTEIG